MGRTATLDVSEAAKRAVVAHVRHVHTDYDAILDEQWFDDMTYEDRQDSKEFARSEVAGEVARILTQWEAPKVEVEADQQTAV